MKFYIDKVAFDVKDAIALLKYAKRHSLEVLLETCWEEEDKELIKELWEQPVITAEQVMGFENTEQRMVAIKYYGMENLLADLEHEVIDTQTIVKNNKRWRVNSNGDLESYIDTIRDTYSLIKVKVPFKRRNRTTEIDIYGVLCNCTSTGRQYFIYIPPKKIKGNRWSPEFEWDTDAIEAICRTFRVNVKPQAVKAYRRHGDVILTIVKPEYKDNYIGEWRTITKYEYLNKLESET